MIQGLETIKGMFSFGGLAPVSKATELTVSLAQLFGDNPYNLEAPKPQDYGAMEKKYGVSSWVYICAGRKARDLASAPFVVNKVDQKGGLTPVDRKHDLAMLLRKVNPWLSTRGLIMITSLYLDLTGNAFWLLFRDNGGRGKIREIYPINPISVRIFGSSDAVADIYEVWHYGKGLPFPAYKPGRVGQVIHFRRENPTSDLDSALPSMWGVGPLEATWSLVVTDESAVKWNRNLLHNDGRPTGMLTSEQAITPTDAQGAAEEYRRVFGGPAGAGKILVLGKNLKYERLAWNPQELDYRETREALREEIMAAFDLNSAVLGFAQGDIGKRSEMHRDYWEGGIVSTSNSFILPVINEHIAPEYGDDIVVTQDWSGVRALQENEEERSKFVKMYFDMGVPMKELNRRFSLGFEESAGMEQGWLPSTLVPAGTDTAKLLQKPPVAGPSGKDWELEVLKEIAEAVEAEKALRAKNSLPSDA